MSNQEQWTPGTTPSDAKLGTDDPAEEAANVESQVPGAGADDGGSSDDDEQPDDTGADGTLGDRGLA